MNNKHKNFIVAATFIIFFAIPLLWFTRFEGFLYIHNGTRAPIFAGEQSQDYYLWDSNNSGQVNLLGLNRAASFGVYNILINAGLSARSTQMIVFSLIFSLPFLAFFYGSKYLVKDKNLIGRYLGAILYTLNLYIVIMWHSGIYTSGSYIPYILAPLALGLHYELIKNENTSFRFKTLLILVFVVALTKHAYSLAMIVIPNIGLLLFNFKSAKLPRLIKDYLLVGSFIIALSLWWVVPVSLRYFSTFSDPLKNSTRFKVTQTNLPNEPNMIELAGLRTWAFGEQWGGRYFMSFSEVYLKNPLLNILWAAFFITVVGIPIYHLIKEKRKVQKDDKRLIILSSVMILFSLFVAKRSTPPLGDVSNFMIQKVPVLNLLRTPDTKLLATLVMFLSFMLVLTVDYIDKKLKKDKHKYIVYGILITIVIIYSYPIYDGSAVIEKRAGNHYTRALEVPHTYEEVRDQMIEEPYANILQLPPAFQGVWNLENDKGYRGWDVLSRLIDKPVLTPSEYTTIAFILSTDMITDAIKNPTPEVLDALNVGYIFFRNDSNGVEGYPNAQTLEKYFVENLGSENLEKLDIENDNLVDVYKRPSVEDLSFVELSNNLIYYVGETKEFVRSGTIVNLLPYSTFMYDYDASIKLPSEEHGNSPLLLSGFKYITKYQSIIDKGFSNTSCPEGLVCYKIYNPLDTEAEFEIFSSNPDQVGDYYLNEVAEDTAIKYITGSNVLLNPGENTLYTKPIGRTEVYPANEMPFEKGTTSILVDKNPESYLFDVKFSYESDAPVLLRVNYYFNKGDKTPASSREAGLNPTSGVPVEVPLQILLHEQVNQVELTFTQYTGNGVKTMSPVKLSDILVAQIPAPSLYFARNVDNSGLVDLKDKGKVRFTTINPTKYVLNKNDLVNFPDAENLVFKQSYTENWVLMLQNDRKLLNLLPLRVSQSISKIFLRKPYYKEIWTDHFMADGYANGWMLDNNFKNDLDGWDNLVLEYRNQRLVYTAEIVSFISLIALLSYFGYRFYANHGREKK